MGEISKNLPQMEGLVQVCVFFCFVCLVCIVLFAYFSVSFCLLFVCLICLLCFALLCFAFFFVSLFLSLLLCLLLFVCSFVISVKTPDQTWLPHSVRNVIDTPLVYQVITGWNRSTCALLSWWWYKSKTLHFTQILAKWVITATAECVICWYILFPLLKTKKNP